MTFSSSCLVALVAGCFLFGHSASNAANVGANVTTNAGKAVQAPTLERAFQSCMGLSSNALADDLMRSIWEDGVKQRFSATHAARAKNYRLDAKAGEGLATVELIRPGTVAGLVPLSLTAMTCPEGCGLAVWQLSFGALPSAAQNKLAAWAQRAPAAAWTNPDHPLKVRFHVEQGGNASLVCDLST